jgi:two-component system nitrogen regulation response regulator NtrX
LKQHLQDIPALVEYFSGLISGQSGLAQQQFSPAALAVLKSYDWPGNVRQLRNVVEWVLIMQGNSGATQIEPDHLPPEIRQQTPGAAASSSGFAGLNMIDMPLREAREVFEKEYLFMQISRFDGNISKTAEYVGMERSALHRKLKSLQILSGKTEDSDEENEKRKRA